MVIKISVSNGKVSASVNGEVMRLNGDRFFMYDERGRVVCCFLHPMCTLEFAMDVDCVFKRRRKVNYGRGEVFAVGGRDDVMLYIPFDAVGLEYFATISDTNSDIYYIKKYDRFSFKVEYFESSIHSGLEFIDGRVFFNVFKESIATEALKDVIRLKDDILETCGVCVSEDAIKEINRFYEIKKRV
jgi:hypothetical protein